MSRSGGFWAGVVFGGAALGAVVATGYFVSTYNPVHHDGLCTVTSDEGTWARTTEQASNAALVAAGAARLDLGTQASTIGVATAMQESTLQNLDYGDRDSLGLFQQRPSQGWGTEDEILNPHFATVKFYSRLSNVDGWEDMRVTDAAQAVQRSGFPEAYEQHAPEAAAWAEAIRGDTPFAAVNCDLDAVAVPSTGADMATRIAADFGDDMYTVALLARNDRAVLLGVTANSGSRAELEGLANWAVAVSDVQAVASVRLGDVEWLREQGIAEPESASTFDGVLIGVVETVAPK